MNNEKVCIIYTVFSSLGDFIVMGDLIHKINSLGLKAYGIHLNSPYVKLWKYGNYQNNFFNAYKPLSWIRLFNHISKLKREGYVILGLQQAPGSIRGFYFLNFLKKCSLINYIVDFNLLDADIVTPPKGRYILQRHLYQITDLIQTKIPEEFYHLDLPVDFEKGITSKRSVCLHPWSKRSHLKNLCWPFEHWLKLIEGVLLKSDYEVVVTGKDSRFSELQKYINHHIPGNSRIIFKPSDSVHELIQTIDSCDTLVSVNTSAIHIGYALDKKMVILQGYSLEVWVPESKDIYMIEDEQTVFKAADKFICDPNFPSIARVLPQRVLEAVLQLTDRPQ